MVYSALSYRQWQKDFLGTIKRLRAPAENYRVKTAATSDRGAYDLNKEGAAAPQTEFVSKAELEMMCQQFSKCNITAENIGNDGIFSIWNRKIAMKLFSGFLGLDLYCCLQKS